MGLTCVAALTAEFPNGITKVRKCLCKVFLTLTGILLLFLTHPSLFLKELLQLFLLAGQLQLQVLTARQKALIVL